MHILSVLVPSLALSLTQKRIAIFSSQQIIKSLLLLLLLLLHPAHRHSPSRRPLLHFGLHTQQRVCLSCRSLIDEEGHRQRLLWRRLRTDALLKGHYDLLPYVNAQVHTGDRAVDKLARVVEGAFSVLGTGLYVGYVGVARMRQTRLYARGGGYFGIHFKTTHVLVVSCSPLSRTRSHPSS